jgi:HSP20 family protein
MRFATGPVGWVPAADCYMSADAFVVRMEIPGVKREDLKVFLSGGECVVTGRREQPEGKEDLRPMNLERPWGEFERRFLLPRGAHPDKIGAKYADGLLEVRVGLDGTKEPREMKVEQA